MNHMKPTLFVLFLIALPVSFISAQNQPEVELENANQHIAIAVTLASFYCQENRWPLDLNELRRYSEKEEIALPVEIDWPAIEDSRSNITISETVNLRIPSEVLPSPGNSVSSINSPPDCRGNTIKTNVHINLDD